MFYISKNENDCYYFFYCANDRNCQKFSDDIIIDCKHSASMIKLSIESGDDWTALLLYDVDIDNFDKQFIPCLADSLGGSVIADNTIMYNGKTLSFRFDNTEVIVNYS